MSSSESNPSQTNVSQGRGIVEKSPFRVVGLDKHDLETGGHRYDELKGARGRPQIDRNWRRVGKDIEEG